MKHKYLSFIICIFISLAVWLVYNLSMSHSQVETIDILVHSNIEGRREVAYERVPVTAQCQASGFRLLSLSTRNTAQDVFLDASKLKYVEGDFYVIPQEALLMASSSIFGANVTVNTMVTTSALVRFQPENCRKVPVRAVCSLSYSPQYMAMGPMSIVPDSVLVYGEPSRLESVEYVFTKTINRSDVSRSLHGTARLETPGGTRISTDEVYYSQDVARYVEVVRSVPIEVRGVPEGRQLIISPSSARVTLRYVFPRSGAAEAQPSLFVDYAEFAGSITGKCMIMSDANPSGVIGFTLEPKFCECMER